MMLYLIVAGMMTASSMAVTSFAGWSLGYEGAGNQCLAWLDVVLFLVYCATVHGRDTREIQGD